MKAKQKKIFLSIVFVCLISLPSFIFLPAYAADSPIPPVAENCRAACIYDKTHGKVILMQNPDGQLNTSTSAKVMMGLLACEMLSERLDETVTVTQEMLSGIGGYSMKLKAGESIRIIDLLYGAICASYNDAAYVLASICGGDTSGFVSLMNDRARSLGAVSTNYINPLGYPDNSEMLTTLSDTLKIALAASDNELYMELCSAKKHDIPATNMTASRSIYNRNNLVSSRSTQAYYNPLCRGLNAGNSGDAGGWSIITLAEDDGAEYICIILGGDESPDGSEIYAYDTANTLIDWACDTYNSYTVFRKGQVLGKAEISLTAFGAKKAEFAAADDLSVYIPNHSDPDISYKIKYISDNLSAPIKANEKIGVAAVYCNSEFVGECDIVLTEDCEANTMIKIINTIGSYTKSRAFIITLICFALILPVALIINNRNAYRRSSHRRF